MKIGHVHLKVTGLAASERFYCDVLGLKVTERVNDYFVFLSFGEAHHDVALQEVGTGIKVAASQRGRLPGLYHSAFEVGSAVELESIVERLKQGGIAYSLVDHKISWAVYTEDPSGNGVEIFLDRRRAPDGAVTWNGASEYLREEEIQEAAKLTSAQRA